MKPILVIIVGLLVGAVARVAWRRSRAAQLRARCRLAALDLAEAGPELAEAFRVAAQATGLPRGLNWKEVVLQQPRLTALDRATQEPVGLVAVAVSFEAIPGGGMEEVEAVSNIRAATAVFRHRRGRWQTDGRTVFNLDPVQTLERYSDALEPLDS